MPSYTRIQFRRGTAAEWTAENPTLAAGEPGGETDTGRVKMGDGVTPWNSRPYAGGSGSDPVVIDGLQDQIDVLNSQVEQLALLINPDVPPTAVLEITDVTSSTATLAWTVDPGSHEVDGTVQGRDPVGALAAYESAISLGLTGTRTYTSLPSGTDVVLYIQPVEDGVQGERFDIVVTTDAAAAAPVNSVLPAITGVAQVGQTLTVSQGTWSGGPITYAYQWKADGVNTGTNSPTLALTSGHAGAVITCVVTATNATGSTSATSNSTSAVAAAPVSAPTNTVLPSISGTPKVGVVLTAADGTWTGSPTLTRQWQTKPASSSTWTSVIGATGTTYTPTSVDVDKNIRVVVTGTNSAGSAAANSAATAVVAPATSTGFTVPAGYSLFYGRDFTVANTADDADWAVYTGTQGNNAANFRAANVVKSGPNGQELIAARDSSTAPIYSGAVKNFAVALPQYFYVRYVFKLMNFTRGSWPSFWSRPHNTAGPAHEGEIDYFEAFGDYLATRPIAAAIHLTPYGTGQVTINGPDWGLPTSVYGSPGVYGPEVTVETYKVPNQMRTYVNGVLKSTINRPAANAAKWDAQMEVATYKWYMRLDHQAGFSPNGAAGTPATDWRESRQSMLECVIGIPS